MPGKTKDPRSVASPHPVNAWTRTAGFTLIELMVVVIIIGILLGIIGAGYGEFRDKMALRGFAASVITKAREAKNTANALNKNTVLHFDITNGTVWYSVEGIQQGAAIQAPTNVSIKGVHQPTAGSTVTSGTYLDTFFAYGRNRSQDGGDLIVHMALTSEAYAANEPDNGYYTLFIIKRSGPKLYSQGCVSTGPWATNWGWQKCESL